MKCRQPGTLVRPRGRTVVERRSCCFEWEGWRWSKRSDRRVPLVYYPPGIIRQQIPVQPLVTVLHWSTEHKEQRTDPAPLRITLSRR